MTENPVNYLVSRQDLKFKKISLFNVFSNVPPSKKIFFFLNYKQKKEFIYISYKYVGLQIFIRVLRNKLKITFENHLACHYNEAHAL